MSEEKKIETPEVAASHVPAEKPCAAPVEKPSAVPVEKPAAPVVTIETKAPEAAEAKTEPVENREKEATYDALPEAEVEVDIRDDRDEEAESLITWGAARAGVIVVAPLLGTVALMANEVYMISKIGEVYGVKLADKAAMSFIGSLGGTITGSLAATLIPLAFMQVPIAVGVTYGIGKAAKKWIKDGMPDDVEPYMAVFEKEKEKGEEKVDEIEKNPLKEQPLGDEKAKFEAPEQKEKKEDKKKLYPDQAHEAFGKLSGKLTEVAGVASSKFIDALKKAGVTDEQIEKAKYTAIGVTEVAREAAIEAAKDLHVQAKVKSKEWSAQAKVKSEELTAQAKVKSKDLSEQAKAQLDDLKEKSRKLKLEADIRAAEARVQSEKAKAEARIRMAQARVKAAQVKVQAAEQAEEAKAKAAEISAKVQDLAKEYKETAVKAAAEAKENFRNAAEDFKSKALERADQRRAEQRAAKLSKDQAPSTDDSTPHPAETKPVEQETVEKNEEKKD